MNKVVISFVMIVMVLTAGVFADSKNIKEDIKDHMKERGEEIEDKDIKEINLTDLPDAIKIDKIKDTNIAIYEVNSSIKPLFVLTSSSELFREEVVPVYETKLLLQFGLSGATKKSEFLNMATGVQGSLEKGYVMMRGGSITGIATNMEITSSVKSEEIEVIIYKNGEEVGFRNVLSADSSGVKIDYDVQSSGIVTFEAGDVISVYVDSKDGATWDDVTTTVEITN